MADVTLSDFKEHVLIDLRVHAPGETIPASNTAYVTRIMNEVFGELVDDGVIDWTVTNDVPENRVFLLKEIVMNRCARQYGKPVDNAMEQINIGKLRALRDPVAETTSASTSY